jgi:pyruvate formate lyase activating enzyme
MVPAGTVLEIQRMSTEDGPGIRTTVFMKGCPLRCAWCHNPESIDPKIQIHWIGSRCIGCRTCIQTCTRGALSDTGAGIAIDRKKCDGCGECAEECPSTAMEQLGLKWRSDELVAEIVKDRAFFEKSGGGITISGGEPLIQAAFCADVFKRLKAAGVHTAVDTCGLCKTHDLELALPHADLVLFDLKIIDSELHKKFTGAPNARIHESLLFIRDRVLAGSGPRELWVRTPIIPGATDRDDVIAAIGGFIGRNLNGAVSRWDLCAFNNLCRDKYTRLGMVWDYADAKPLKKAVMEHLAGVAKSSVPNPEIVLWSGATRLESE